MKDWQPYPVDPYSRYMCDHKYIHTSNMVVIIYCYIGFEDEVTTWYYSTQTVNKSGKYIPYGLG